MQRIIDIVSVLGGTLGLTVVPIVLAFINRRNRSERLGADPPTAATFGIPMSVDSAIERGDRIANDYLLDLRAQRDDAKAEARAAQRCVDELESRLDDANDTLRHNNLPEF